MRLSLDKLRAGDRSEENRKVLRRTLEMTYVLSVFYELEGIRDHRGKDKEKCEEKAVEAQIFFEIVSGGAASEQSRKAILENLNRPCAEIDLAVTWAHLLTAFPDAKTYLGTKAL
jgi:hypothetical protein